MCSPASSVCVCVCVCVCFSPQKYNISTAGRIGIWILSQNLESKFCLLKQSSLKTDLALSHSTKSFFDLLFALHSDDEGPILHLQYFQMFVSILLQNILNNENRSVVLLYLPDSHSVGFQYLFDLHENEKSTVRLWFDTLWASGRALWILVGVFPYRFSILMYNCWLKTLGDG